MPYTIKMSEDSQQRKVIVVGCGGTGSLVADGLCRLLRGTGEEILLVDYDRVEPHNLYRQNFYEGDIGKFKSQALAERLARQYGRKIGYSVYPFDKDTLQEPMGGKMYSQTMSAIIIGAVDNTAARRSIADSISWGNWWLDSGNGHHSGQVLIGNAPSVEHLQEGFEIGEHIVCQLPVPSLQLPSLLIPPTDPETRPRDCAEAVEDDEQSPTINQTMATLVLEFMYRLLKGKLTWMGAYIDMEAGTLQTVPAEPVTVARMCGVKVSTLMANKCALGARYHV